MSRIAKQPINLPSGVETTLTEGVIRVKGPKGELSLLLHDEVSFTVAESVVQLAPKEPEVKSSKAQAGTARAIIANMVKGVSEGFERKLNLVGVGYRVQVQGNKVNLTLGYSHPVVHELPKGIEAKANSQTELSLTGIDKQLLGQVAAEIRGYRPPEAYKGKGVRYSDERVRTKEVKKK